MFYSSDVFGIGLIGSSVVTGSGVVSTEGEFSGVCSGTGLADTVGCVSVSAGGFGDSVITGSVVGVTSPDTGISVADVPTTTSEAVALYLLVVIFAELFFTPFSYTVL